jgi:hypothetical protein
MKSKKEKSPLDKLLLKLMGTLVVNVTSVSRVDFVINETKRKEITKKIMQEDAEKLFIILYGMIPNKEIGLLRDLLDNESPKLFLKLVKKHKIRETIFDVIV